MNPNDTKVKKQGLDGTLDGTTYAIVFVIITVGLGLVFYLNKRNQYESK